MEGFAEYGYIGLFAAAFLAATVIPMSSDIVLVVMVAAGFEPVTCVVVGTAGNWLGGMTSYYLGYLGKWEWIEKWLRISPEKASRVKKYIDKYGSYTALLSWLPFVGDAMAVVLGLVRSSVLRVAIFMLIGKGARYAFLAYAVVFGKERIGV
jgi:membrane protein YqaA with SNARE-associated domain